MKPDKFEIRTLNLPDLDAVFALSSQVKYSASWSKQKLEDEIRHASSLALFVSTAAGEGVEASTLVAFVFYRQLGEALEISWLATHPEWQRRGQMSALFRALTESVADAAGQTSEIWLEVHENNKDARNLYEKIGFVLTSRRPRYYSDGGAALLLALKLT